MLLKGKTAVITGANRGIGSAMVDVFARNGANLIACVRNPDEAFQQRAADLADEWRVGIDLVQLDLADEASVKQAAREIVSRGTPIDVLINNAGVIFTSLFQMTPLAKTRELFDINLFAQMAFTQAIAKAMCKQGGSIINLSSSAAIEGNEGRAAYAASKSAMIAFTKVIARELARYGVRANAIAPGLTQTEMMQQSTSEDGMRATLERIAMNRVGEPEEVANVALFLASDLSSYMTGQVLRVDGGLLG
jgi:3-oxoacyl-[acyl-carrier protein] reductase